MKQAFMLLGIMTCIVSVGAYLAFRNSDEIHIQNGVRDTETKKNAPFTISSSAFKEGEKIHIKYTCYGDNIHPPITIQNAPKGTVSFVLVMVEPTISETNQKFKNKNIEKIDHWAVYNIKGDVTEIKEGEKMGEVAQNEGETGYRGPCPSEGVHQYFFTVYALSEMLSFEKIPTLTELENRAKSKMIDSAFLMGHYEHIIQ